MITPISTHIADVIVNVTALLPKYSATCPQARAGFALALVMLLVLRSAEFSLRLGWGAFELKLARAAGAGGSKTEAAASQPQPLQAPLLNATPPQAPGHAETSSAPLSPAAQTALTEALVALLAALQPLAQPDPEVHR